MRFKALLVFLLVYAGTAIGQSTTVTGTLVDSQGTTWINATVTATFYPTPGRPGPYIWSGGILVTDPAAVTSNDSGVFSISLPDNTTIAPAGSQWSFSICPNASMQCVVVLTPVTGSAQDISTLFTAQAVPPGSVAALMVPRAYVTGEVSPNPPLNGGALIWNTTASAFYYWNGTSWAPLGSGGGGGCSSGGANGTVLLSDGSGGCTSDPSLINNSSTHNLTQKFLNNQPYASQFQTAPGANNGIATFFAANPTAPYLIADNGDGSDYVQGGLIPSGAVVEYSNQAQFGYVTHNCPPHGTTGPTIDVMLACQVNETYVDTGNPAIAGAAMLNAILRSGAGYTADYLAPQGPWTVTAGMDINAASFAPGILNGFVVNAYHQAAGDVNAFLASVIMDGGGTGGSDQVLTGIAGQFTTVNMQVLHLGTTTGTGDQHPEPAPTSGPFYGRISAGLVEWLLDYTKGSAGAVTMAIVDPSNSGTNLTPGTYIVPCTGGGGSGATLKVIVEAGGSTIQLNPSDVTVNTGGSLYTSGPTCTLTAAGGTPPLIDTTVAFANTAIATGTNVPGSTYLNMLTLGTANAVPSTGDVITTSGVAGNTNPGHYVTDTITATVQNNHPLTTGIVWNTGGNPSSNSSLPEMDIVDSVSGGTTTGSTQTIVLEHVNSINVGSNFYQGGTQGCLEFDENFAYTAIYTCWFAYGAYDSSHIIYGNLSHGSQNGNFLPSLGDMMAGLTPGVNNALHIFAGIPVLYTDPAVLGSTGSIGGFPTVEANQVPWASGDVLIVPQPAVFNSSGGLLLNFTSNVPANGQGDALINVQINGPHWTGETQAMKFVNTEPSSVYTIAGGPLNSPQGILFSGVWTNFLTSVTPPQSGESILRIEQDGASNNFLVFSGTQSIIENNATRTIQFSDSISAPNGEITGEGYVLHNQVLDQILGINIGPSSTIYDVFSSANAFNDAVVTAGKFVAPEIVVGAQNPDMFIANFPTGSGTTYSWSVGCTDSVGSVTVPVVYGTSPSGPSSLSSSNFYNFGVDLSPGCATANVYRLSGTGGVGLILSGITPTQGRLGVKDIGQTASGAIPTVGTSGKIVFSDGAIWDSSNGPPSGPCTNGSQHTSTAGTTANILWACGSSAWQLVK